MRNTFSYAACVAAIGFAQTAAGSEITTAQAVELDEITLTASGAPVALSRTGASVSVLNAEDLKRPGDQSLASRLAQLTGLSLSRNGGIGTSTALRIRGLGPSYVGVRIDGIDVADPSGTQCSFDFGTTMVAGLSRVEVLRGAQSALYGSEAIGGVVDLTTFRAGSDGVETQLSLEGGSAGSLSASASVGVKKDRLELAVTASRNRSDGISAYAEGPEADAFHTSFLSLYAAWQLTPDVKLGFNGFARNSYTEFDSQTADSDETEHGRLRGGRAFAEATFGGVTHALAYARTKLSRDYPLGWVKTYQGDRRELSWKGRAAATDTLSFTWGLDRTTEHFAAGGESGHLTNTSASGEALWAATPDLDLSLALRRDDHDTFGGRSSGRFAAAWRPSQDWVLRAVAATGFRAPSLYELYSSYGNRALRPETSRSYELSAEYLFGGAGSLQLTLFDTRIENRISFGNSRYEQVPGTTRSSGTEITGRYQLSPDWALSGSYTYTDARSNAQRAVRVPRHDLSLGLAGSLTDTLTARVSLHSVAGLRDNGLWPAPASALPDYTLVHAALGYAVSDRTEAWLRVENLFDQDYQSVRNYGQPGRQIFVGLATRF